MYSPVINHIYDMQFLNKDTGFACGDSGIVLRITNASTVGISQTGAEIVSDFKLYQNYPNPFNPTTVISYYLPVSNFVLLKVFDINGKEVAKLVNQKQNAGSYSVEWNAENYPSGIYFYTLEINDFRESKKMLYIK